MERAADLTPPGALWHAGSCHCGRIRYEGDVDPALVTICHCTDCQKLSGTGYRIGAPAAAATFEKLWLPSLR